MIKNLIFDWSGTLSDDIVCVHKAMMEVFRRLGLQTITFEEFRKEVTLPYMNFCRKYTQVSKEELDPLFVEEIHKVEEPKLYPHVSQTLNKLKTKGIKMALLSSHPQTKLEKEIKNYGLKDYFIAETGSVHDKREVILGMMGKYNFNKRETAYIGDMTHDIEAGKKAGVITIAITWGYEDREKLMLAKPDYMIDNLKELENLMTKLSNL